jgi:large subunit ribosomal protein L17
MRHRKSGLKLNMTSSHRTAMFKNMVTSLLKHDKIRTTSTRAKELRGWADHLITLAKRGDLHARRQALSIVREKNVVHKLFEEASERFSSVAGGYTRVIKIGRRAGDAAPMSLIELVAEPSKKPERKITSEKRADASVKTAEKVTSPPVNEADEAKGAEPSVIEAENQSVVPEDAGQDKKDA